VRQTLDSLSRLSGFDHAGAQVNVAVQANVSIEVAEIKEWILNPSIKTRTPRPGSHKHCGRMAMNKQRELAYAIDPALWAKHALGVQPQKWQSDFLRAPRGASIAVLTARQVGKTTTAAWAVAHFMIYSPGSLSVVACPAQRQSAEAVRKVKAALAQLGIKLKVDNVYGIELENGSRVLALPSSDDSIRG
jgi:hypothetical protein